MKFQSISTKLNIAVLSISFLALAIGFFVLNEYKQKIKTKIYNNTQKKMIKTLNDRIAFKMRVGITNAISISNDERIRIALRTNNRILAINSLKDISSTMKRYTHFKNIKIHLHTKENKSFLRNWKLDKYGDDLSSFRYSVVSVNTNFQPLTTFEPGRAGLLLRAITPIADKNGTHLGSLEFIQGINSVVKALEKSHQDLLLLMQKSVANNIKKGNQFFLNKSIEYKDYIISQKHINQNFLNDAKTLDLQELLKAPYILGKKYFYTHTVIRDFNNKTLGIALLGEPLSVANANIDDAQTLINLALYGILGMIITIGIVIIISIHKLVIRPLQLFEDGLLDFFLFLQGKKDYTNNIDIKTNDEFGVMAKKLIENIAVSAKLHEDINTLNTNLESKVQEKTQNIATLLDNAGQGFLSFSCDLIIDAEYSKECLKLLGEDLAGKYLPDILFQDTIKQNFFKKTILEACRIDSLMIQKSILSLLPQEIILHRRALKLKYKILQNKNIMLIITNITKQKKLEKKVQREQEILKMIVEIISESDSFYDTKKEYENFIYNYQNFIDTTKTPLHNVNEIYRLVHTFKGAFSQLYMNNIVNFLHSIETELSHMLQEKSSDNTELFKLLQTSDFDKNLQKELAIIEQILGNEFLDSANYLKIKCSNINKLQEKIHRVFKEEHIQTKESQEITQEVQNLSNQKLINLLYPYTNLVQQVAIKLGKEIYHFEIIGDQHIFVPENYKPFFKSLIHLFRNSVDHGIEDPETRLRNNKDEKGTISCNFIVDNDTIQIIISDDGAGINKEKVITKALKENIIKEENVENMSTDDIYNLIFHENFSTKDTITTLSGRGVGLNVVKSEINKLGGNIDIKSQLNIGTTFILNLPNWSR